MFSTERNAVPVSVAESYRHSCAVARRTGRNFYYSFLPLPRPLARDMCVLYAFLRKTDDLGDELGFPVEERAQQLEEWRQDLDAALAGDPGDDPVLPALADVVRRHRVSPAWLHAVIDGVASDLQPRTFETFDQLKCYTYQVAGAVGLCCIEIWGHAGGDSSARAIDCGTAFQLTNILRDLAEDAAVDRVYLPEFEGETAHSSTELRVRPSPARSRVVEPGPPDLNPDGAHCDQASDDHADKRDCGSRHCPASSPIEAPDHS